MSLINVQNLTFSYDASTTVFQNISFAIDTDWKLGFVGRSGRGKTTFLRLLMGEYEYAGKISSSVGFSYFPFDVPDRSRMGIEIANELCQSVEDWEIIASFHICRPTPTCFIALSKHFQAVSARKCCSRVFSSVKINFCS